MEGCKEDWAYLAGIVDGEGYLSIGAHISPSKTYTLRPILDIGNTDKQIIDFCHKVLGGRVGGPVIKNRQTPFHRFRLYGKELEAPLQKLLPYLISKREVAGLILKWISLHHYPKSGYSTEEIKLANQVRDMSRKNGHRARQIPLDKVPINIKKEESDARFVST